MIMILIISGIIIPAFIWLFLYLNIIDQYIEAEDGEVIMTETKAEAQKDVLHRTIKSPFFWVYSIYSTAIIFAAICSINTFGLGDWYFSL